MKNYYFLLLFVPFISLSQSELDTSIDSINNKSEAKVFIKSNRNKIKGKIITFNRLKHKTKLANELFEKSIGSKKVVNSEKGITTYKILDKKGVQHFRTSIMLFDSKKTTIAEINSLRSFILKGIRSGEHKFENLARVYSSHPSAKTGGDLGWIKKGTFSKRFEKSITDKRIGQVFSFDEHREKKHYVIKKTADTQLIEEITVLKIESK